MPSLWPSPDFLRTLRCRSARRVASVCHELQSQRGEGSGAFIAREALAAYQSLDGPASEVFFALLVKEFFPRPRGGWQVRRRLSQGAPLQQPRAPATGGGIAAPGALPAPQHGARRDRRSAGDAAPAAAGLGRASALGAYRGRPRPSVPFLVQPRIPGPAAHRLAHLRPGAGEADPVRSGARDPGLERPAPPASGRPPLLRVFSIRRCPTSR